LLPKAKGASLNSTQFHVDWVSPRLCLPLFLIKVLSCMTNLFKSAVMEIWIPNFCCQPLCTVSWNGHRNSENVVPIRWYRNKLNFKNSFEITSWKWFYRNKIIGNVHNSKRPCRNKIRGYGHLFRHGLWQYPPIATQI
jgi:hypothetical protein